MSRFVTMIGWDDAPHLNPPVMDAEERDQLLDSGQPHQKEARKYGKPSLGAGAIYPVTEELLFCDPFPIPEHWEYGYALDPGWRTTAALLGARDPDTGQSFMVAEYYGHEDKPIVHSHGIKSMLPWRTLEGCIDPAGDNVTNQKDGAKMREEYEDLGLVLRKANNAVSAGLRHVLTRVQAGQLKVFSTLTYFKREWRLYRRDEKGKIVKDNDHLMDCWRYLENTDGAYQQRPINAGRFNAIGRGEF